ncbi:hypothetical protein XELAEV_18007297mg [Xenopus laevis]|uniref:Ig-like domain-containing protein n=1 Tax=Xenopus laevis TaxID=8355 RepID=A0A974I586_XENLA|nr:hypothetical protein XELAEV_18007297mg [Xenopus laevis]
MILLVGSLAFFSLGSNLKKIIISLYFLCFAEAAEEQLIQPSFQTSTYGDNVHLPCNASGFVLTDYWLAWLKQIPGEGPLYLGRIRSSNTWYSPAFNEQKFKLKSESETMVNLIINNVNFEDSAVYYCAREAQSIFWVQETV